MRGNKMKVVAYNGSPRVNGNTHKLIEIMFEELNKEGIETVEVNVGLDSVKGCVGCGSCKKNQNNKCVIDDKLNEYYKEVIDADGIILASPVYYADVTGQMKCFIDRFATVGRANGTLRGKVGCSLAVARRNGAFHTYSTLNAVMGVSEMVMPGSNYWNQGVGRAVGEVLDDADGVQTVRLLAKNMAALMKQLKK